MQSCSRPGLRDLVHPVVRPRSTGRARRPSAGPAGAGAARHRGFPPVRGDHDVRQREERGIPAPAARDRSRRARRTGPAAARSTVDQRVLVDQAAAGGVDQGGVRLHRLQQPGAPGVPGRIPAAGRAGSRRRRWRTARRGGPVRTDPGLLLASPAYGSLGEQSRVSCRASSSRGRPSRWRPGPPTRRRTRARRAPRPRRAPRLLGPRGEHVAPAVLEGVEDLGQRELGHRHRVRRRCGG